VTKPPKWKHFMSQPSIIITSLIASSAIIMPSRVDRTF
jgi:hypothetical protein